MGDAGSERGDAGTLAEALALGLAEALAGGGTGAGGPIAAAGAPTALTACGMAGAAGFGTALVMDVGFAFLTSGSGTGCD